MITLTIVFCYLFACNPIQYVLVIELWDQRRKSRIHKRNSLSSECQKSKQKSAAIRYTHMFEAEIVTWTSLRARTVTIRRVDRIKKCALFRFQGIYILSRIQNRTIFSVCKRIKSNQLRVVSCHVIDAHKARLQCVKVRKPRAIRHKQTKCTRQLDGHHRLC